MKEMCAMPTMCKPVAVTQPTVKMDSQEEHGGATHESSGEPGLLPAHDTIPG